ncbi:MAG: alpha-amylase family glycosyl hydrolase [Lachnospiraceae bacterium]|nr:alpha-amylase family glycosyl hydrolase [Lachnospiraceae bacterium]
MKKKLIGLLLAASMMALMLTGCARENGSSSAKKGSYMERVNSTYDANVVDDKYRTTYEIFVGSFYDSDGDGTGDLNGVTEKIGYIRDMGFNEIWLMPICPSPTYHKYDVTDYTAIDPAYGTMDDFEKLVKTCHDNGIRLITDLVLNHTSTAHPWFKEAAQYLNGLGKNDKPSAKDCPYVNYYNFSREAKEGYAQLAGSDWYYEARFWEGMPDLNLDNEAVKDEIKKITDFWLNKGVDGFRLDAVTSYYTGNDDKNIAFLKWLNDEVKTKDPDAYMVGECWTDYTTYARYYKSGIDSFFDFSFANDSGAIASTVRSASGAKGFGEMMVTVQDEIRANNKDGIEAPFYTNHDMARSAGYYPGDDGSKVKLATGMNLMMSGNAFVYYGEELGMKGSGKDENKRAPMYWSSDSSAKGMTRGPDDMDSFEMKFDSEDKQAKDDTSILNYVKQAVKLRNTFPVIARGTVSVIDGASDDNVLAIEKKMDDNSYDPVVIVYNVTDKTQTVKQSALPDGFSKLGGVLISGASGNARKGGNDATSSSSETSEKEVEVTIKDGSITMPAQSIAIFTDK